jgi:ProP effector
MLKSLTYYVNTAAYHKSVLEGVARIDLEGNESGVVSAEEAKYSIDRHQAKLQNKKQLPPSHLHTECKEQVSQ